MLIDELCGLVEERKSELFELLSDFIKVNTESFVKSGNEKALAEKIYGMCKALGLESEIYSPLDIENFSEHPDFMPGHGLEDRPNVNAVWKGKLDENELMLMAHTDTVQIGDLSAWKHDPLGGEIVDGRIYGRGASDDKYALAVALFLIKLLRENGFEPKKNLVFSAYCDEEYGGSHGALAAVLRSPSKRIVSMDCEDGQIWHCGSGGGEVKYIFHTNDIVDSAKKAAMAIPTVLECLDMFARSRKAELENNRFYKGTEIPDSSMRYMGIRAGFDGMDLGKGEMYFVYYTDKTKPEIEKEFEELSGIIAQKLAPMGITGDGFLPSTRFFHYVFCEPDSEDVQLMVECAKEASGRDIHVCGSCLSDLSVISKYGSSRAYAFGAGRNFREVGGAHQTDEFIECDKLVDYAKAIGAYIIKVLG